MRTPVHVCVRGEACAGEESPGGRRPVMDAAAGSRGIHRSHPHTWDLPGSHDAVISRGLDPAVSCALCCSVNPFRRPPQLQPRQECCHCPPPCQHGFTWSCHMFFLLLPQKTSLSVSAQIPSATFGHHYVWNWDQRCKVELSSPPPLFSQISVQEYSLIQISGFSYYGKNHRLYYAGPVISFFE